MREVEAPTCCRSSWWKTPHPSCISQGQSFGLDGWRVPGAFPLKCSWLWFVMARFTRYLQKKRWCVHNVDVVTIWYLTSMIDHWNDIMNESTTNPGFALGLSISQPFLPSFLKRLTFTWIVKMEDLKSYLAPSGIFKPPRFSLTVDVFLPPHVHQIWHLSPWCCPHAFTMFAVASKKLLKKKAVFRDSCLIQLCVCV